MSIGSNIRSLREERRFTQEQVADKLGITFQAVSSWERDEYKPDVEKLIKLAELFGVSVSALVEERQGVFKTKDAIYNWEHMKTYVKTTAKNLGLTNTLKAVTFATEAHKGQMRKRSSTPYMLNEIRIVWGVEPDAEFKDVFAEDNEMGNKIVAFSSNRDGLKWLPIFTSREEVGDYAETNAVKLVPIREILEKAYEDADAAGIIINPNTDGFALCKEAIEIILNNSDGCVRHAC